MHVEEYAPHCLLDADAAALVRKQIEAAHNHAPRGAPSHAIAPHAAAHANGRSGSVTAIESL
jgi:hypothetical protein